MKNLMCVLVSLVVHGESKLSGLWDLNPVVESSFMSFSKAYVRL